MVDRLSSNWNYVKCPLTKIYLNIHGVTQIAHTPNFRCVAVIILNIFIFCVSGSSQIQTWNIWILNLHANHWVISVVTLLLNLFTKGIYLKIFMKYQELQVCYWLLMSQLTTFHQDIGISIYENLLSSVEVM